MQITQDLIRQFFDQTCSASEADKVVQYFREHPEEMERWLQHDWVHADADTPLPDGLREKMLLQVRAQTGMEEPKVMALKRMPYLRYAAAAIVLLLAGWLALYHTHTHVTGAQDLARQQVPADTVLWDARYNNTAITQHWVLPDGSGISLFPKSRVRYAAGMKGATRTIWLNGTATFTAAKNTERPFIVNAGAVSTVVLGTRFTVHTHASGVTVKLYSGKVMLKPVNGAWRGTQQAIVLAPGQQLDYDETHQQVKVNAFDTLALPAVLKKATDAAANHDALVFDAAPLPDVMNALEKKFGVGIHYNKADISDLYFTGKVLPADDLAVLLQVIANINHLTIEKGTDGFTVKRIQD